MSEEESEDHSYLHLPGILLAYSLRAPGLDPNEIKSRFLSSASGSRHSTEFRSNTWRTWSEA